MGYITQQVSTLQTDKKMEIKQIVSVRLAPNDVIRLREVSSRYGVTSSMVISAGLGSILDKLYDSDGNLLNQDSIQLKSCLSQDNAYYTIKDVSKCLGVNPDTLGKIVRRNRIKVSHFVRSGSMYVLLKDILKLYGKNKHE